MKNLLIEARKEIYKEMDRVGFIDDSDGCERFLVNLAYDLILDRYDIDLDVFLEEIISKIMVEFKHEGRLIDGDYKGCYYKNIEGLKAWVEFWSDSSSDRVCGELLNIYETATVEN